MGDVTVIGIQRLYNYVDNLADDLIERIERLEKKAGIKHEEKKK